MPRKPEPRWDDRRGRWFANIGDRDKNGRATEVFAPESIRKGDRAAAWEWFNAEVVRRSTRPSLGDRPTLRAIGDHYLYHAEKAAEAGRLERSEYGNRQRHVTIACQFLGDRVVADLTARDATELGESLMAADLSPTYSRNVLATLRHALNWAVGAGMLADNPIRGYRSPTVPRAEARYAEAAEAGAFLRFLWRTRRNEHDAMVALMVRMMIRSGARPKELCSLEWTDIRWAGWKVRGGHESARATLPASRWKAGGKTGRVRTIYLLPSAVRALRRLQARSSGRKAVFVHGPNGRGEGAGLPWRDGTELSKPIRKARIRFLAHVEAVRARIEKGEPVSAWEGRAAGLALATVGPERITNYRWRHTAASSLLMAGVTPATVAELLGTSVAMLDRHYGHLMASHLEAAATNLMGGRR